MRRNCSYISQCIDTCQETLQAANAGEKVNIVMLKRIYLFCIDHRLDLMKGGTVFILLVINYVALMVINH